MAHPCKKLFFPEIRLESQNRLEPSSWASVVCRFCGDARPSELGYVRSLPTVWGKVLDSLDPPKLSHGCWTQLMWYHWAARWRWLYDVYGSKPYEIHRNTICLWWILWGWTPLYDPIFGASPGVQAGSMCCGLTWSVRCGNAPERGLQRGRWGLNAPVAAGACSHQPVGASQNSDLMVI